MNILNSKGIRVFVIVLGSIIAIIPIIVSFWMGIDVDSAIILTEMERIYDGYVPYITLHLNYPPLYFYICVALKWLFHIPYGCYWFYHLLHYIFVFLSAYFVFKISRKFNGSIAISLLCTWLFLMVTHWTQGNIVIFEMPSICFGFLAMYLCLSFADKKSINFLWIGTLSTCAFLVKQFGAGFCVLGMYLILFFCETDRWKKLIYYIIGYSIPILICILIWGRYFVNSVILNGYGTDTALLAGYDTSFSAKISQITGNMFYFCYRICPIVFAAVVSIPFVVKKQRMKEFLFCVFGILGFALSFWFVRGGLHYTLYITPFAILLIPIIRLSAKDNKFTLWFLYITISLTALFALYSTYRNRVYKGLKYQQLKAQTETSMRLSEKIEQGKTVWIIHGGIEYLYYFNNLTPPNMSSVGYATGPLETTKEKQWKQVKSADYVIRFTADYPYEYSFDDEVKAYVNQFPSDTLDDKGAIVIHKMK